MFDLIDWADLTRKIWIVQSLIPTNGFTLAQLCIYVVSIKKQNKTKKANKQTNKHILGYQSSSAIYLQISMFTILGKIRTLGGLVNSVWLI